MMSSLASLVKCEHLTVKGSIIMSQPQHSDHTEPQDGVEAIVPLMPVVLPVMGGLLMLLLAFIAVFLA
jgi:hypothetical protein